MGTLREEKQRPIKRDLGLTVIKDLRELTSQHGNGALKKLQTELEGEPLQSPQAPQRIE